jgi:hypothetical protein
MRFLLGLVFLFSAEITFCQILPPAEAKKIEFTRYNKYQRQQFYPFNKATAIKLVSFGNGNDSAGDMEMLLPVENDTLCLSKLKQAVLLKKTQTDSLTDILYNTCSRWTITQTDHSGCYFPRNAIVFLDQKDRVLDFIEICFECRGIRLGSKKIKAFDDCSYMFNELQSFFRRTTLATTAGELERAR